VAHSAMSGNGTTAGDDPLQTAVWRLRSRACWVDAAALLRPDTAAPALQRTALLVERCLYTEQGWEDADDALRTAEALAHSDDERGAAACERGYLAYAATLHSVRDRADEARAALGRAAALIPPGGAGRALLDFRRGLVAENLARSPQAARAAYRRAHAGPPTRPTRCCCRSPIATWPDWPCGTGSWRRPGTASPNPCGSGRSWATSSARHRLSPPSRTRRPSRRRPGCARRRGGCSGCSGAYRPGWHGSWRFRAGGGHRVDHPPSVRHRHSPPSRRRRRSGALGPVLDDVHDVVDELQDG
jgi:hypothetical protein